MHFMSLSRLAHHFDNQTGHVTSCCDHVTGGAGHKRLLGSGNDQLAADVPWSAITILCPLMGLLKTFTAALMVLRAVVKCRQPS